MTKIAILCLVIITITCSHVLKHFDRDISHIRDHLKSGDTSRVFSTFMKMLFQTKMIYEELDIIHPKIIQDSEAGNCTLMMEEIVAMLIKPEWAEIYQEIYPKLHRIQQKCTNADFQQVEQENGFDDKCALCAVLSRVIENYVEYHRKDVASFVQQQFCTMFDGLVKPSCEAFVHYMGPFIIKGIINKQNSDVICHSGGMCPSQCKILDTRPEQQFQSTIQQLFGTKRVTKRPSPWKWLVDLFVDKFGDKHNPPFDLDNDSFSDISTFRGHHWRGADCNEFDSKVYPGRKTGKSDMRDHDCNGIFGVDAKKKSLQEKFCANSKRYGVVVAGDSAGAHFSIPQRFFNVSMMQKGTFDDLLPRIADELDIPHQSTYTAHTKTDYPSHSIYKHLRKWNLCNNNDFQNLGVNGGDSGNSQGNIKALKRNQTTDQPVLFFLELIGNDVCGSGIKDTSPKEFKKNILKLLDWLQTKLPKGSHVIILGLADGNLLFEYLTGTIHPLNVPYDNVYTFLNCLKISPCFGWLNTNETARRYTTELAKNLSKVYKEIVDQKTYNNFDIVYHEFPTEDIFKRMYLQNRQPREMIQRCDGFHPSGLFNSYLADWLWFKIITDHPEWIGDENPHNQEIKTLFGLEDLE